LQLYLEMITVVVYMDDTIVLGYGDFDLHMIDVEEVLRRLQEAGFQVNPNKCVWFAKSVAYLGFTITREGIKPQTAKAQGNLSMQQPRNLKSLDVLMEWSIFIGIYTLKEQQPYLH
jgi:hypothetical protein